MKITPIKNNILFKFVDRVNAKGEFEEGSSSGGILLKATADSSAKRPRWATVVAVGEECKYAQVGSQILLPALRWTPGVKIGNDTIWKTDENEVVAVRLDEQSTLTPINKFVLFKPIPKDKVSSSVLIIVADNDDTPKGSVLHLSDECSSEIDGKIIYYDDTNFFETIEINNERVSFIKEDNILMYS